VPPSAASNRPAETAIRPISARTAIPIRPGSPPRPALTKTFEPSGISAAMRGLLRPSDSHRSPRAMPTPRIPPGAGGNHSRRSKRTAGTTSSRSRPLLRMMRSPSTTASKARRCARKRAVTPRPAAHPEASDSCSRPSERRSTRPWSDTPRALASRTETDAMPSAMSGVPVLPYDSSSARGRKPQIASRRSAASPATP
jgi:hypothetical protein